MTDIEKVVNKLNKRAMIINRVNTTKNILIRVATILTIFLILMYGTFLISKSVSGNLEVTTGEGDAAISICETYDFKKATDLLKVPFPGKFNNISYTWLPSDINDIDGPHSGESYMAFTFYLKNESKSPIVYTRNLQILNCENELDECLRVMIIRNDTEYFYYAKGKKDTDNEHEDVYYLDDHIPASSYMKIDATPFESTESVFNELQTEVGVGQIDKYTVVIWIEGSDPECNDDKLSGLVKFKMVFNAYLAEHYFDNNGGDK